MARDPKRIPEILGLISEIWNEYPDLRLCQLLENVKPQNYNDMYYIEDSDLITLLKLRYKKWLFLKGDFICLKKILPLKNWFQN